MKLYFFLTPLLNLDVPVLEYLIRLHFIYLFSLDTDKILPTPEPFLHGQINLQR